MLGFMHFADARFGWWEDRETAVRKAEAYTQRALALDPDNSDAHRTVAGLHLMRSEFAADAAAARRAAELGPNLADALVFAGFVLQCSGSPEEAIHLIEKAMALSPAYPANYLGQLGNAYRLVGRMEDALRAFRGYHARSPGFGLADIVILHEQAGRLAEARETATQLLAARPGFTVTAWARTQFRCDTDQLAADLASLRAAGVPD